MCKTVIEFAWRATQQLIVYAQNESDFSKIKGWGSGFFIVYRDLLFFVTADHCIHFDDYSEGRIGSDDMVCISNNINDKKEFRSILTPIGSFFYFDKSDPSFPTIPDLLDFSFSIRKNCFEAPFLTTELKYDGEVLCEAGKNKLILNEDSVVDFDRDKYYVSVGTCLNRIKNEMIAERANAVHVDLRFRGFDSDGNAMLDYPYDVKEDYWAGLSGGPIFDNECRLAGLLIRVSEESNTITAIPMKKVLTFMDYAIKYEKDLKG